MNSKRTILALAFFLWIPLMLFAQVGEHRNNLSIGANGGYVLSNVGFIPKVTQGLHGGMTSGVTIRYVSEKYFKMLCSIYGEVNYAQIGWKENIVTLQDEPVINETTNLPEQYSRTTNYIQVPVFAHLAWGKEQKGLQFFINLGPQFGFYLNESTKQNFEIGQINFKERANTEITQYKMPVENKFDYGIVGGIGLEYSIPKIGHFLVDARYYYGLGNIYGDSKRDYFANSNLSNIAVKLTYLFDITKTNNNK